MPTTINTGNLCGGPAQVLKGGTDLGPTKGGVKITTTEETEEMTVDQCSMALEELQKKQGAEISFNLADMSLNNFNTVLGGSYGFGQTGLEPLSAFTVHAPGPNKTTRTFTFHKGRISAATEVNAAPGEQMTLAVKVKLFADLTKPQKQQLFTYSDS